MVNYYWNGRLRHLHYFNELVGLGPMQRVSSMGALAKELEFRTICELAHDPKKTAEGNVVTGATAEWALWLKDDPRVFMPLRKTEDRATQSRGRRRDDRAGLSPIPPPSWRPLGLAIRHGASKVVGPKGSLLATRTNFVSWGKRQFPRDGTGREAGAAELCRAKSNPISCSVLHSRR